MRIHTDALLSLEAAVNRVSLMAEVIYVFMWLFLGIIAGLLLTVRFIRKVEKEDGTKNE